MINWRDVRNAEQYNQFHEEFIQLDPEARQAILKDMNTLLIEFAQMDPMVLKRDENRGGTIKKQMEATQVIFACAITDEIGLGLVADIPVIPGVS